MIVFPRGQSPGILSRGVDRGHERVLEVQDSGTEPWARVPRSVFPGLAPCKLMRDGRPLPSTMPRSILPHNRPGCGEEENQGAGCSEI